MENDYYQENFEGRENEKEKLCQFIFVNNIK